MIDVTVSHVVFIKDITAIILLCFPGVSPSGKMSRLSCRMAKPLCCCALSPVSLFYCVAVWSKVKTQLVGRLRRGRASARAAMSVFVSKKVSCLDESVERCTSRGFHCGACLDSWSKIHNNQLGDFYPQSPGRIWPNYHCAAFYTPSWLTSGVKETSGGTDAARTFFFDTFTSVQCSSYRLSVFRIEYFFPPSIIRFFFFAY